MNCRACGASIIEGSGSCYRCGRVVAAQDHYSYAPRPAPAARRPRAVLLVAATCFALAGVFVLDALLMGDPAGVLVVAVLYAVLGFGVMRGSRHARVAALVSCGASALLGVVSLWGGALAGWLVLAGSATALAGLSTRSARRHFRPRAA